MKKIPKKKVVKKKKTNVSTIRKVIGNKLRENSVVEATKYIRDPIHDIIKIENKLILKLLDSWAMQRLRRIHQLGSALLVYPGAEHSRFTHSLGVYHLTKIMLKQLNITNYYDCIVLQCAALLHDIGHGPFSHAFERFLEKADYLEKKDRKHESWTQRIIMEDDEISNILSSIDKRFMEDIRDVISKVYYRKNLIKIVSSQFDVDRFDYMLRDSHMTGVKYGVFDLNWLIRCLSIHPISRLVNGRAVKEKTIIVNIKRGISALEEYLLGNLYLYKHVYFHKAVQAADGMIINMLIRAIDLLNKNKDIGIKNVVLEKIANKDTFSTNEYCQLDDRIVYSWMLFWATNNVDNTLHDLARRFLNRRLFKSISVGELSVEKHNRITKEVTSFLESQKLDPKYYLYENESKRIAYEKVDPNEIFYVESDEIDGNPKKFSEIEGNKFPVSNAITEFAAHEDYVLVVPDECRDKINEIINKELK